MIDEFPSLGRLDVFAESLSLVAGYGIKACLIAQDLSQIHAAYGHDEAITSNCHTRVAFAPNRIETARLLSQMTGETTVRHAHRTISNSGASVSEPEVARPLITPDEAMRLGSSEALIFTSGRPAIRTTKLRYYADLSFKRLAQIAPPSKSDRIERPSDIADDVEQMKDAIGREAPELLMPEARPIVRATTGKPHQMKPVPAEQLSFLKFAFENGKDPADASKEEGIKERLL